MKSTLAAIALFAAAAFAQNFTLNTPGSVVECQPVLLSWVGGSPPFYLSIHPGGSPNGAALQSFPATNASSYTWQCNIASGTSIGFSLTDSTGTLAQTAAVTVQAGTSTSCSNSTSVSSGPTGSSTSAAATTPGTTTPAASTGETTGTGTSTAASTSPTTTTSSSSGASANAAQFGAAGIVGAAVAALFF